MTEPAGALRWVELPAVAGRVQPGQYVRVLPAGAALPVLYPVADAEGDRVALLGLPEGVQLAMNGGGGSAAVADGPCGRPFRWAESHRPLLVGGGSGGLRLLLLWRRLREAGRPVRLAWAGPPDSEVVKRSESWGTLLEAFPAGPDNLAAGAARAAMAQAADLPDRIFAAGPSSLLQRATELARSAGIVAEVALQVSLGCGIGLCLGCAVPARAGGGGAGAAGGPLLPAGYLRACQGVVGGDAVDWKEMLARGL